MEFLKQSLLVILKTLIILDEDTMEEYEDLIDTAESESDIQRLKEVLSALQQQQAVILVQAIESDPLLYPTVVATARQLWQAEQNQKEESEQAADLAMLEKELE